MMIQLSLLSSLTICAMSPEYPIYVPQCTYYDAIGYIILTKDNLAKNKFRRENHLFCTIDKTTRNLPFGCNLAKLISKMV
jgi:hypothetical protein